MNMLSYDFNKNKEPGVKHIRIGNKELVEAVVWSFPQIPRKSSEAPQKKGPNRDRGAYGAVQSNTVRGL